MKISQLISGTRMPLSNEESNFVSKHGDQVRITSLDERGQWIAQNLVRKGAYSISKDNNTLIREVCNENN